MWPAWGVTCQRTDWKCKLGPRKKKQSQADAHEAVYTGLVFWGVFFFLTWQLTHSSITGTQKIIIAHCVDEDLTVSISTAGIEISISYNQDVISKKSPPDILWGHIKSQTLANSAQFDFFFFLNLCKRQLVLFFLKNGFSSAIFPSAWPTKCHNSVVNN